MIIVIASYIIILVQQIYFQISSYLAKFLDTSAKSFFSCSKNKVFFFKPSKQIGNNSNKRILRKPANASLLITSIDNNLLVERGG